MIRIQVTTPEGERTAHRFEGGRVRVGRADDNDVVLKSVSCSRHHAEVVLVGSRWRILDLGSANGLQVGSKTVTEADLDEGSSVEIAGCTLRFSFEDEGDATVILGGDGEAAPEPTTAGGDPGALYLVRHGGGPAQSLKVVRGASYVIGRAPDADLVLSDRQSSKRHASLFWRDDRLWIRDERSSNGTRVDGREIDETALGVGSRIAIGGETLIVRDERSELSDEAELLERTVYSASRLDADPSRGSERGGARSRRGPAIASAAAVLLAALAAAAWFAVSRGGGAGEPAGGAAPTDPAAPAPSDGSELLVRVARVEEKELAPSVSGTGTLAPDSEVTVSAEISGRIAELAVSEGARVTAGALLARLDDAQIRLQIEETRSAASRDRVDLARERFEQLRSLESEGVTARSDVAQARDRYLALDSAYQASQAKLGQLREQLAKTRITAPISGRVVSLLANSGEVVGPGTPLFRLEDAGAVVVELELSDRDVVKVRAGQAVEVTTNAWPERVFAGSVDSVSASADPATRTFGVEARVENADGSLRSGMIVSARIVLEAFRGLVVPEEALLDRRGEEAAVYRVVDGVARTARVRLGRQLDRAVEVVEGLAAGDEVVVYGLDRVRDGERIETYGER